MTMKTIPEIMVPLLATIRTKDERDNLREQVKELEATLFRADPKGIENVLRSRFSETTAGAMRKILARAELKDNPAALRAFFQELKDVLDQMLLLKVSLAFTPTEDMFDKLHEWTQKNLGVGVVTDISFDRSMLGGARIIFGGKYKEMTLAQMITDVLKKEEPQIRELIKIK